MSSSSTSENPKAKCIHRISRLGLDQLITRASRGGPRDKASAQCPVTGCPGLWTAAGSVLDEEMVARMEMHARSQANLTQQQDAVEIED